MKLKAGLENLWWNWIEITAATTLGLIIYMFKDVHSLIVFFAASVPLGYALKSFVEPYSQGLHDFIEVVGLLAALSFGALLTLTGNFVLPAIIIVVAGSELLNRLRKLDTHSDV